MTDDTIPLFSFPAVQGKKITAAFDGGRMSSDGGVMLLSLAERRLGVAERLACCVPDRRDPTRIAHTIADMIRARVFAICCGYEDADDLDDLRRDPAFKLACGRLPDTGRDLCSQPTLSRLENAPGLKDVIRLTYALVDQWMASYATPPARVTLDIDDTCDVVHGHQQLSLFNAHYDERCFLPIHVYDAETSRPVVVILRPGKTPSGVEVRAHLRRLVRRIRARWPTTRVLFRGDGHYARPEAMTWCEDNDVEYLFGLPGTKPLSKKVDETADAVRTERAVADLDVVRGFAETRYRAGSWGKERRRPHRGDAARSRHPLRRHQSRSRLGRMAVRDPLLRPRTGGKSDQAAQGPARLRSHVLPVSLRQPGSPRPPHRRLLADARRAQRHSQVARPRQGGVRDTTPQAHQNRRPRRRNGKPRPPCLRRGMPERRSLRLSARRAHAVRSLNDGACAPARQVPSLQRVRKVPVSSR